MSDLSSLLIRNQAQNLLNTSQLLGGLPGSDANNALLTSLLLKQQAEERQKTLLATQMASLNSLASFGLPSPPTDNLSLLLQQQRQLQALQGLSMNPLQRLAALGGAASTGNAVSDLALLGNQSPSQLDALSKILQAQQSTGQQQQQLPTEPRKRKGRTGTFPQKLHQILLELERQEGGSDIASFLPHGRAFAIHKPREFVKEIMPKHFRMSRFSSFQRQLNLYDFQRVTEGPDKGAYYHELFIQGRPILSTMMKRNKIKGVKITDDEPETSEEQAASTSSS